MKKLLPYIILAAACFLLGMLLAPKSDKGEALEQYRKELEYLKAKEQARIDVLVSQVEAERKIRTELRFKDSLAINSLKIENRKLNKKLHEINLYNAPLHTWTAYGQSSSTCIPIADYRILTENALRSFYLDSLVENQSKRIALDSVYKVELDLSYRNEIKGHEEIENSLREQLQIESKLKESFKEEAKTLRRRNRWGKVKMWGVAILAGVAGYGIGSL